jgi:alkylated DNA repair protein alkB family protein 8
MSRGLLDIARRRGHEVAQCDIAAPALPYRAGCADRVLSIAVLHHVATHQRRAHALASMARLLRPGCGARLLLYVWSTQFAVTQVQRGRADPSILEGLAVPAAAGSSSTTESGNTAGAACSPPTTEVPTVAAAGADMLVGFTERAQSGEAKGVHNRFYHLSTREELEALCAGLGPEYRTREIWYDSENWAADVERL